jgi:hypothetical protein
VYALPRIVQNDARWFKSVLSLCSTLPLSAMVIEMTHTTILFLVVFALLMLTVFLLRKKKP